MVVTDSCRSRKSYQESFIFMFLPLCFLAVSDGKIITHRGIIRL